jgi:hypothetical protein
LYSSIQDSINSLKSKLQTKERDVALEKLKRQSFLDKKTIFEEEVKALNYRK